MEKRAVVTPGITRPVNDVMEKAAATEKPEARINKLDRDFTKTAADAVTDALGARRAD